MKKFITLTAVVAAALTLSSCDCFKKMAKNPDAIQVSCTPEVLVLNNGKIAADISASIPADYFNKKAALKVTPVLFFEGGAVAGETLLLQGEKVASNGMVVASKESLSINRHVEFDYQPAMDACELKLLVEVKCKSGKCKEFTLINANNGAILTAEQLEVIAKEGEAAYALKSECGRQIAVGLNTLQKDLDFAVAMEPETNNYKNVTTTVVTADLVYKINSSRLNKKAVAADDVVALKQSVESYLGNDRAAQTVYVNGYASPDGPEKFNDKLSAARSESGKKAAEALLEELGLTLDAASYGEDWDGFKELVAASNIEDKELILSVLNSYNSSSEREEQIKNMSQVFSALKKDILPQLRRAQLVNSSDITGKTDDEMAALVRAGKFNELDEKELLHIASTGKLTQAEKIAVLEYAAKEYKSVAAYNNLGVAYAEAGEGEKAAQAFASAVKAGGNAAAINTNLALVNLMNGETEAAKAYTANASSEVKALAAAAEGNYAQAQSQLEGYNAAVAATMNADYTAAKQFIANDATAQADYLRAVIATKQGDMATATAELKSAIAKDASYAERCKKDVNLRKYIGNEIQL